MNKVLITTLLLCTGLITAGCEKTYSVAEFKKDEKLRLEWDARCGFAGTSKNCENMRLAFLELQKEYEAKAAERSRKIDEENRKSMEKLKAEQDAWIEKMRAKREAREHAEEERRAKERAAKEQNNH
ncbi:EexN family lipoprotein [Bartonella krasnovii]|uniref:EexN family lipoprotein n=1 Tax=Bartonella krasnovii TaxID=2267275 RepID=UPI001F4CBB55|nr:EexN family lipoprotein [Bartonella krasnovii]UNF41971.1 EexN family lipoprotein [Bartonella krasnovii]UNF43626.1 EexN family lipoprotein [Bartonella krasnovii]UNF46814.1 EexN family lipoprotein [Bartonella krasnovii]UNF55176.1 EexN family lipoprotein [Bartonella krasnovii]